jgi:hypothetical protein
MSNPPKDERRPKLGIRRPPKSDKSEESLREQSRTETEERPYLDTQGGE